MSYTQLIPFKDGLPQRGGRAFINASGWSHRVWTPLLDRYIHCRELWCHKPPHTIRPVDDHALWALAWYPGIHIAIRRVHAFTFDRVFIRREHFAEFAGCLEGFNQTYPTPPDYANHLPEMAEAFRTCDAEALGLYGHSVGDNLWWYYESYVNGVEGDDDEEQKPVPILEGFDVFANIK